MAELADALASGASARKGVEVRVLSSAVTEIALSGRTGGSLHLRKHTLAFLFNSVCAQSDNEIRSGL